MDELIKQAGFKEGTPTSKVKVILSKGKWKPRSPDSIQATQMLFDMLVCDEENYFYELCRDWGFFYGLLYYPEISKDELIIFRSRKEAVEKIIEQEFGVDVTTWGNPLEYDCQC